MLYQAMNLLMRLERMSTDMLSHTAKIYPPDLALPETELIEVVNPTCVKFEKTQFCVDMSPYNTGLSYNFLSTPEREDFKIMSVRGKVKRFHDPDFEFCNNGGKGGIRVGDDCNCFPGRGGEKCSEVVSSEGCDPNLSSSCEVDGKHNTAELLEGVPIASNVPRGTACDCLGCSASRRGFFGDALFSVVIATGIVVTVVAIGPFATAISVCVLIGGVASICRDGQRRSFEIEYGLPDGTEFNLTIWLTNQTRDDELYKALEDINTTFSVYLIKNQELDDQTEDLWLEVVREEKVLSSTGRKTTYFESVVFGVFFIFFQMW